MKYLFWPEQPVLASPAAFDPQKPPAAMRFYIFILTGVA
jgi:hypothetical protein